MLYKFKSIATAEVIMLQPDAERILRLVGKEPGPQGVITAEQIPAAVTALKAAIVKEDAPHVPGHAAVGEAASDVGSDQHVDLHQRALPFIQMLEESVAANRDVVWGV